MPAPFTLAEYLDQLPEARRSPMAGLREVFVKHLPPGFSETISAGAISFSVPHTLYPSGYHCNPEQPLPFMSLVSQKNFIAMYHMGLYAMPELLEWFLAEYPRYSRSKPDMGKSCVRFKKPDQLPMELLKELAGRVDPQQWITVYEATLKR